MNVELVLNRTQDGEPGGHRQGGRGEDRNERRARELAELLQEVRVMLPGVQVFFAFLLTVPFSARFGAVMPLQEADFFGTLVCTALSAGLLLTPSVHHGSCGGSRPGNLARGGESSRNRGHGTARGGDGRAMFVITDILFGSVAAAIVTAAGSGFFLDVWSLMPIRYRLNLT
jgi:hypothetical protein